MAPESLFRRVTQAEKSLSRDIEEAEQDRLVLIESHRATVRKRAKETLQETPEMKLARENVERLQLRLELLRNIKMNWRGFQTGLSRKGMQMRLNQHAHLEHLIDFLESGCGIDIDEGDENGEEMDSERALMTFEIQPTGAGKTGAFAIDIALMDVPSLTLVPFDSLLIQTKKDMIKIGDIAEDQIGIVGGGLKEFGHKHTIATYAGHAAQIRKGGEYAKFMKTLCKLVICDEVHHQALGDRMQESISEIDTLSNGEPTAEELEMLHAEKDVISHLTEQTGAKSLKIGFTATPRGAKKNVKRYFPHCLGRVYHRQMVEAGLVVPYKIIQCDGSVFAGEIEDYVNIDAEARILDREKIYGKLAGEYADVLSTYRTAKRSITEMPLRGMAFCTNHAECEKFVKEANDHGIRCRIVTGREAKGIEGQKVVDSVVDALNNEEIDLIVTVEKLATGFNRPEINAVIWARITSAAKTIQGIGRGARSHTYPGNIPKEHCLVFETNWQMKDNAKNGRRPLRLTDALIFNGEEPEAICSMADGSPLEVICRYALNTDGTVDIDGKTAVSIEAYCRNSASQISPAYIHRGIKKAGFQPVPNVHVYSGAQRVKVYWKEEIDKIMPHRTNECGIVAINGREAVCISPYARSGNLSVKYETLMQKISEKKLQPVTGYTVLSGKHTVTVYWKDEIDALLPQRKLVDGVVDVNGREAIGISAYAEVLGITVNSLTKYISQEKLKPVAGVQAIGGTHKVDVYWKDEVDAVIPKKLDESGVVEIRNRLAVGIRAYGATFNPKIDGSTMRGFIRAANLQPISNVKVLSGNKPTEVYWKDEIDALLKQKGKL